MRRSTNAQTVASTGPQSRALGLDQPCTLVIFGAGGDLTKRKLLPALYNLHLLSQLPERFAIIGVARKEDLQGGSFRDLSAENLKKFGTQKIDPERARAFLEHIFHVEGDFSDPSTYQRLDEKLKEVDTSHACGGNAIFYMAVPPRAFAPIVEQLSAAGLTKSAGFRRVVVEKPFGRDLESSRELNAKLRAHLDESQIFRIDHYLGKETVQNLLIFRFANGIFEPIWNHQYIDDVQITVGEELGVEARGGYYDTAGVLRDMIQNHMLQLLTLVAMEPPSSMSPEHVRNEKVKVLESIALLEGDALRATLVRGQYGEGVIGGKKVPAYRSEPSVAPDSVTETFAAVELHVENWRWAGVPFYLRSGKRLKRRDTEIVINFKRPPLGLFHQSGMNEGGANRLIVHVQPDEGIQLQFQAKVPGNEMQIRTVDLDFSYKAFGVCNQATGYERLLFDVLVGDVTLFYREDMVEAAWKIATPMLEVWAERKDETFPNYAAGSWGPEAANELLARNGHKWVEPS